MRAIINPNYGTPDVLQLTTIDRPTPGPDEILVRVHSTTVTHGDRRLRAADFPGIGAIFGRLMTGVFRPRHPVGGSNFAGRVVEVGKNVTRFAVGDDVFGGAMHGAYAEYVAVPEQSGIAKIAEGSTYGEAAALPYGAVTALSFLRDMAQVRAGERVLIVGATGGVGRMAIQIAKHLGAEVTAVCSGDPALARSLGADEVIDYKREDFTRHASAWDVILDTTEGNHFRKFRPSLTPHGRYLSLYVTIRLLWEMAVTRLRGGPRALTGVALGDPELAEDVRALAEQGAIRPLIARRFALEHTKDAHAFFETERPKGSVVIDVVNTGAHLDQNRSTGQRAA